jgi:hypothetical protein
VPRSRFQRWTDTPHLIAYVGTIAVISILALVIALAAQAKTTSEAKQQANRALQESRDDNRDLCTFLVTTADALDKTTQAKPSTPAGEQFRQSFIQVQRAARDAAASPDCPR